MNSSLPAQLVRSLAVTYPVGYELHAHSHPWAQLIYACSGVMEVQCDSNLWIVPPTKAVWIPAQRDHGIRMRGAVALRTLYLPPDQAEPIRRDLGALEVVPLLGALITHIADTGMLERNQPAHRRLAAVLGDLLVASEALDLMLPMPCDPRALRMATRLRERPDEGRRLAELADQCGASLRTIERLFLSELGMPLGAWRQKARLIQASALLAEGSSVTHTAIDCGYESVSAFIAAFRRQFGTTPGRIGAA